MTFKIEPKRYATLLTYAPVYAASNPVEAGTPISEIVEALNIPRDQVKLILSNSVKCELATLVNENERIGIFPRWAADSVQCLRKRPYRRHGGRTDRPYDTGSIVIVGS